MCRCAGTPGMQLPMSKLEFAEALDVILADDARYPRDAYHFLRESLDFTFKARKKAKEQATHVSGQQLLEGIRQYALKQYGPMVTVVFDYWRLRRCEDFGEMVFNLVRVGVFGKTERDSMEDFKGAYTFHDAFVVPYLPAQPAAHRRVAVDQPAEELN